MTLWNDLLGLQDELQRLLQTPGSFFREPSARGVFPPLNVFRGPDGLIVRAEGGLVIVRILDGAAGRTQIEFHQRDVRALGRRTCPVGCCAKNDGLGSVAAAAKPHRPNAEFVGIEEDVPRKERAD